jgi:hypothetical protein
MKSIQNQYIDLKEGRISQQNFMRNLRMTMPQYITNVTSFGDAVRILKNKSILNENMGPKPEEKTSEDEFDAILNQLEDEMAGEIAVKSDVLDEPLEEVEGVTADAEVVEKAIDAKKIDPAKVKAAAEKAMRGDSTDLALLMVNAGGLFEGKGKELHPNAIHPGELRMGIRVEMEHTDNMDKAKKIALDHLAENPFYYTALKLSGIESPSAPKVKQPEEKKAKKAKETIQLVDLVNGMQKVKMPKKDEKKKIKESVDEKMYFADMPADPEKYKIVRDSKNYIIKATNADGVEFQKGDVAKTYDGEEIKIAKFEESQGKVKAIYNKGMFFAGIDIDGLEAGKPEFRPGVDMGGSFEKMKSSLEEIIRETISEYFDGRDNLVNPLSAEEESMNEGYYDDIAGYTSVSDNGTGFKDNDKVKSKSGQEGFVYDVLKSKEGKALVVVKWQKNGNTVIAKYGEGFSDINDISK